MARKVGQGISDKMHLLWILIHLTPFFHTLYTDISSPLARAREGGGQILPSPHVFVAIKQTIRLMFTNSAVPF